MNTLKSILLSLLITASITSCFNNTTVHPSNNITILNKEISDYEGIDVSSAFVVDVEYSSTDESIEIEANDNLHQYIEVEKVNNLLRIKIQNGVSIRGNATLKVHIVTNDVLNYFAASGASTISLTDDISSDDVTISLSGASKFNGTINSNTLDIDLSGASNADLQGSTESLSLDATGASTLSDFDMVVQDKANIRLSGASNANLTINGTIDVSASGASNLRYKGTGSITDIDLSGASQVIKVD